MDFSGSLALTKGIYRGLRGRAFSSRACRAFRGAADRRCRGWAGVGRGLGGLLDEAVELPSFRHPLKAAYVFGPERGSLSPAMIERCDHLIKIPTSFCINVATAAAIVLYDRTISLGRFGERPVSALAKPRPPELHVHGGPRFRRKHDF